MTVYKRRIQKVAGSTYSISLPKKWVEESNLSAQEELNILEKDDKSLIIFPGEIRGDNRKSIDINIDKYSKEISQILYSLYYYGFRKINLFSKNKIDSKVKKEIRRAISDLSGTEIIYEDEKSININVMLNDLKVDIFQIFYRINLLLNSSIENLINEVDWEEIKFNEDEIDRLYNLGTKIITSAISDREILNSSGIVNLKKIPHLFLINKKLENIGDNIKKMARFVRKDKIKLTNSKNILSEINKSLNESILFLINKKNKNELFEGAKHKEDLSKIENRVIATWVDEISRYLLDIQKEIIIINFQDELGKGIY